MQYEVLRSIVFCLQNWWFQAGVVYLPKKKFFCILSFNIFYTKPSRWKFRYYIVYSGLVSGSGKFQIRTLLPTKIIAHERIGEKWHGNITTFTKVQSKSLIHSVGKLKSIFWSNNDVTKGEWPSSWKWNEAQVLGSSINDVINWLSLFKFYVLRLNIMVNN